MHVDVSILSRVFGNISNLLVKTLWESLHQGGTSSQHNVVVQANFQVSVALFNGVHGDVGYSCRLMVASLTSVHIFENARVEDNFSGL